MQIRGQSKCDTDNIPTPILIQIIIAMENTKRTLKTSAKGQDIHSTKLVQKYLSPDTEKKKVEFHWNNLGPTIGSQMKTREMNERKTLKQSCLISKSKLTNPESELCHPIAKISMHNNCKLVMATFLDTATIQKQINCLRKQYKSLTVPKIYALIRQYQSLLDRAYSQQIRYYIIAALWDQGLVKVGQAAEWQLMIEGQEYHHKRVLSGSVFTHISLFQQEIISQTLKSLGSYKGSIKASECEAQNRQLSTNLGLVIKQLQQQYYRELLTLEYFLFQSKEAEEKQKQMMDIFDSLDESRVGSIEYEKIDKLFSLSSQTQGDPFFNIHKFGNNLHIYDRLTNTVKNQNSQIQFSHLGQTRIKIENMMEVFNRALVNQADCIMAHHASHTYQTISHILTQFNRMKKKVITDLHSRQIKGLNERNQQVGLLARIQHIKQAASDIVCHGKNKNMMNLRGLTSINICQAEAEEKTYRNQGTRICN